MYLDPNPSRKETLQKYLLSACVPISTISKALGFGESEEVDTEGQTMEEICQELLEKIRIKIEYLKNINKTIMLLRFCIKLMLKG